MIHQTSTTRLCVDLNNGYYALKFQYHMVSEITVFKSLRRDMPIHGKHLNFAAETDQQAGKNRMDSALMQINYPDQCDLAKSYGLNLSDYILVQVI